MKYTTKTEYGIICLIYMARKEGSSPITIKELSQQEKYPQSYIEKIVQNLRAAGIVTAQHGNQGGYRLARKPGEITLRQIIEALEGGTFDIFCENDTREKIVCTHICFCGVKPIWRQTKDVLDKFFDSITLDQLMESHAPAGAEA